ncbi:MAG: hypothetical protein M9951_12435 [Burkholderiaceae bacterium]|nr:hypothetical protein [Burkholderiaceae bacterium]
MAAARPIPSFLQLPIDELADDDAQSVERPRPRDAALARGGSLRLTQPVRIAPPADDGQTGFDDAGLTPGQSARPLAEVSALGRALSAAQEPARPPMPAFDRDSVLASWRAWLRAWEVDADPAPVVDAIIERLGDSRRSFHNLERLASELARLDEWRHATEDSAAVGFATCLRYVILDPSRCDNEARSAEFARIGLAGLGVDTNRIRLVRELIVSTREGAVIGSADARLLADIGRARLADPPRLFDTHEDDLRAESVHLVDAIYWRRRIAAIRAMLIRPRIYLTDIARGRLEAAARGNLSRRLDTR